MRAARHDRVEHLRVPAHVVRCEAAGEDDAIDGRDVEVVDGVRALDGIAEFARVLGARGVRADDEDLAPLLFLDI